jgi:hypothetical protein
VGRFFVLGCQRSGTTLLRLILECHPEIVCYDEIKGYSILQGTAVENARRARLTGFKLPRWTEQLLRPVLLDEGPEGSCNNFYRGEPILFLQRNALDTIASMFKLKAGRASWCELWVPRILQAKVAREPEFQVRYASEFAIIDNSDSKLVGMAALYWKYKNDAFFEYCRAGLPVLAISYEELVKNPRPVLEAVCDHLGVPYHSNLLHHHQLPHTELFGNGLAVGNSNPRQPIQADSVGQWKQFLSDEDVCLVERISEVGRQNMARRQSAA